MNATQADAFRMRLESWTSGKDHVEFYGDESDEDVDLVIFEVGTNSTIGEATLVRAVQDLLSKGLASAYTKQGRLFTKGVRKKRDWRGHVLAVSSRSWSEVYVDVPSPVDQDEARAMLIALEYLDKHRAKLLSAATKTGRKKKTA